MNVSKACNELGSKTYYKILICIDVMMYVTYHLKGPFVILKWNLCSCAIFNSLVNAFYFHKKSYIFELIKHDWVQ